MAPVHALDRFYLALTLLVTIGYQLLGFAIAWSFKFDKITDFTGGSNFFILALLTLLAGNTFYTRNIVTSVLVMIWAVRIAGFLLFRVLKTGGDTRFDDIRSHFFKFFGFWIVQMLWVWTVSLPLTILNSPAVSDVSDGKSNPPFGASRDIAGIIIWTIGFIIETVADIQKYRYKSMNIIPKTQPTNRGLWAWSRHPPYFGEILCWWGIWILTLPPTTNGDLPPSSKSAQYGAVMSPLFTTLLLLFGSGLPMAEKSTARKFYLMSHDRRSTSESQRDAWRQYNEYIDRTSILVPLPPTFYHHMPKFLKRTLFLDFAMYQYQFEEAKGVQDADDGDRRSLT